jgi:predicted HTH domain antitoxin
MRRPVLSQGSSLVARFIAAKFYESGRLSLGQAAEMARLSKRTFAELLGDYGVSIMNYSVADLKDEFRTKAGI